jgi:hypothetical protein
MKSYKAIFFDWDGTAVYGRESPADAVVAYMAPLMDKGIYLLIISGTIYENIAGGRLHEAFTHEQLRYLYFGLARGAHNFGFTPEGEQRMLTDPEPDRETLLAVHDTAYQIHRRLLSGYNYPTDIIFDRPNYCKIDLLNRTKRGEALFMSGDELAQIRRALNDAGFPGGIGGLMAFAKEIGRGYGLPVKPTCDAKYLELGLTTKSDSVDILIKKVLEPAGISADHCCFWGDEFLELDGGVWGSDAFMITPLTEAADFFDVGSAAGLRPPQVKHIGGGVEAFLSFLNKIV